MGMFSEIAEEMEEKAYRKGILVGIFWPVTLPYLAFDALRWKYRAWRWSKIKWPDPEPPPAWLPPKQGSWNDLREHEAKISSDIAKSFALTPTDLERMVQEEDSREF